LAIGVRGVEGDFTKGDPVAVVDQRGQEIARGQINYTADEVRRIMGVKSDRIEELLGECPYEEIIHRDNLALSGLR
jgi:glutamate 5-kinase